MLKIYNFLLNRNPTPKEIYENKNNTFNQINRNIINSQEYKDYTEHIKEIIINTYANIFNLDNKTIIIHDIDLFNKMKFLRENNYNLGKLNYLIKQKFIESNKYLEDFLKYFMNNKNKNINIKLIYLDLIKNNFNYIEMEFNFINNNLDLF